MHQTPDPRDPIVASLPASVYLGPSMSPVEIVQEVARRYGVEVDVLVGRGRSAWVSEARRTAARALASIGMGERDIGRVLHRDRSTVHYLIGEEAS